MSISEVVFTRPRAAAAPPSARSTAIVPLLPAVAPGQLWLVDAPAAGDVPFAPARHAVDAANVVVYDRALGQDLALPLGTYAEPAADGEGGHDAAAVRCVHFARDGWSVVRLLPSGLSRRERADCLRVFVAELAAARVPGGLPVAMLAEGADGITERSETTVAGLLDTVATYGRDTRLAIVIGAFAGRAASAVVANGLAG